MCRKSYQRNKYNAEKGGSKVLCEFYIEHIKAQLERIQLWRPEATFTVQLEKPAKERLNKYNDLLRRNGGNTDQAKQQVAVAQKIGTKGKPKPLTLVEAVKVEHAEHIDAHFSGPDKTLKHLISVVVPWIEGEVASGSMVQMPPIEFLLNKSTADERVIDPKTNYDRWVALVDGVDFEEPEPEPEPEHKKFILHLKRSPPKAERPSFKLVLKKRPSTTSTTAAESALPQQQSPGGKQRPGAASDLPLYVPPPPVGESSKKRKRSSPESTWLPTTPPGWPAKRRCTSEGASSANPTLTVDTALANAPRPRPKIEYAEKCPPATAPTSPGSAYTLVDNPPLMRRGMACGGGGKFWILRSEVKRDREVEESEFDCESPLAKKSKVV